MRRSTTTATKTSPDAVWDVATRVDSLGWTAEFRIPLSQLRYGSQTHHTFGLIIDRDLYRYSQRVSWPLLRQSKAGFVSQFGDVDGFDDLEAPRRLEAAPYVVTKNVSEFTPTGIGRKIGRASCRERVRRWTVG